MRRVVKLLALALIAFMVAPAAAQETPAAKATRKRLSEKITVEWKDIGVKAIVEDIKREMTKGFSFKIDNATGLSNNSKLTYKATDKTVEQILNDLSDKGEFGWFVKSDAKDRSDGFVIFRKYKDKERGYESGKEPKSGASLSPRPSSELPMRATTYQEVVERYYERVAFRKD